MAHFGKALDLGLDILEALQKSPEPLAFGELKEKLDIAPASFARFLKLLAERGYVMQNGGGRYTVGWRAVELGLAGLSRTSLNTIGRPALEEVMRVTQESAELAVFDDNDFLFIDREECPRSVILAARPGSRFPVSDHTAIGWLAMAHGIAGKGPKVPAAKLKKVLADGYAGKLQNNNEVFRGAAVLTNHKGQAIGALCVAAPAFRVKARAKKTFQTLLVQQARKTSKRMGG
jgi:DNA-binding IclR family transcriptional regulator